MRCVPRKRWRRRIPRGRAPPPCPPSPGPRGAPASGPAPGSRGRPGTPSSAQTWRKLLCGWPTPRRIRMSAGTRCATGVSAKRALVPNPAPPHGSAATAAPKLRAMATRARDEDCVSCAWADSGMTRARRSPSTGASAMARARPRPARPMATRRGRSRPSPPIRRPAAKPMAAAPLMDRRMPTAPKAKVASAPRRSRSRQRRAPGARPRGPGSGPGD